PPEASAERGGSGSTCADSVATIPRKQVAPIRRNEVGRPLPSCDRASRSGTGKVGRASRLPRPRRGLVSLALSAPGRRDACPAIRLLRGPFIERVLVQFAPVEA